MSQRDVAARTMIDASDVVDLVDRLEAAGFLRRVRDPDDRRRYTLVLTPAGPATPSTASAAWPPPSTRRSSNR